VKKQHRRVSALVDVLRDGAESGDGAAVKIAGGAKKTDGGAKQKKIKANR